MIPIMSFTDLLQAALCIFVVGLGVGMLLMLKIMARLDKKK